MDDLPDGQGDEGGRAGAEGGPGEAPSGSVEIVRERRGVMGEEKMEITPAMIAWLANGKRGTSSNAIFTHVTDMDALGGYPPYHPSDPDDLTRCIRLLEECPEIAKEFHRMATVSDVWARLVDVWGELCTLMDSEAPAWRDGGPWKCPKTYKLMKGIGC